VAGIVGRSPERSRGWPSESTGGDIASANRIPVKETIMPYRISRLGLVEIRSLDLDRDLDYYLNVLGLQLTAREGKTAYLKGWDERHAYSVALTESDRAGMVRMAFRTVDPEDLDYYEKRLKDFGVKYDVIPEDYRRGRALRFTAPSGHTVELYNEMDYTGNLLPTVNPAPWPEGLRGIAPPRLDHTLVTAPEPGKAIEFFQTVLEFRLSEMLVAPDGTTIAAWLWQRPAPHDLAIVPGRPGGFHHAAFVVDSADALFRAADILAMHKARIDYGPGRHGITLRQPPRDVRRIHGVPDGSGLPRHPVDAGPDRPSRLLLFSGAERDVPERLHIGRRPRWLTWGR
jgi:catechol 2,3-dioxygenase